MLKQTFKNLSWKWKLLLPILLLIGGDYIRRRDFLEEENKVKYKKYENITNAIPEGYKIHGIDISKHNGEVWWKQIKETTIDSTKIGFVFVKATEGMFFFDREFSDNWHSARRYGLRRGAYHFYRPKFNATLQAWNFIINTRLKSGDLPPVLDIEVEEGYSDMQITMACKTWLKVIEKHYGVKPIIYTNVKYYNRLIRGKLDEYPLWIANYRQAKPQIPADQKWLFWQHSDKGRLVGINEFVDLNVFSGDSTALKNLCLP
jgi:lysozyme